MDTLASQKPQSWLSWFLRGALILIFLILLTKLFEIQIIKGDYYRGLSEGNRIRHVILPAPRGKILAKSGEILAGNVEIKKRVKFGESGYELSDDLTDLKPEEVVIDYIRNYPLAEKFAHGSGYLGKISDKEVGKINPECPEKGPRSGDTLVGVSGLEAEYECSLAGIPGEELIEVNTKGEKIRSLGRRDPIPGRDLRTSVDYGLQSEIANEINSQKAAVVVTNLDGGILAFYSGPSFDPNLFVSKRDNEKISALFEDQDLPFFNRVIGGTFHPGSVFKPLVAIAALENGVIDKSFLYNDTGVIKVDTYSYSNWYFTEHGRTEGQINLAKAIARSTDTFFYKIGEMSGPNLISKWAQIFGLDKKTQIDIPGEIQGLIPSPDWKKEKIKEPWYLGDTYHMAIGQGYVAITPIELNTYISAIPFEGQLCRPKFNQDIPPSCKKLGISQKNLDVVMEGMKEACSAGGTAYTFFDFPKVYNGIEIGCKTGTAEVSADGDPHAWFTFFAPFNKPEITATVLIEHGGQGSSVAGPIARKIADYYFQIEKSE